MVIFGPKRQQAVFGIICSLSACFNLFGYLFDYIVDYKLNGNFTIINLCLGGMCFIMSFSLCHVLKNNKNVT